jgi:hypothetical protein
VAGVAAQYLQAAPGTAPATVMSYIRSVATPGRIRLHSLSLMYNTPNLLLYTRL